MRKEPPLICSEAGLAQCLGAAGISVLIGTEHTHNSALYSRYKERGIVFSPYDSGEFIEELCELGETLDYRPVIMSYDDRLILNVSRNRERLSKYYRFQFPEHDMVEKLLDKLKFVELAEEFGLPAPESVKVNGPDDLNEVGKKLHKPYLVKPLYRHQWFHEDFAEIVGSYQKAFVCDSIEELEELYGRLSRINEHVVVQEFIEGPDDHLYDINMYIDGSGSVKGTIVAQKLRVFPPTAGYGSYVVTVDNPEVKALSIDIARKLDLEGLVNIQFKRDVRTGEYKLIEIHLRTSIFDVIGLKADLNLPAIYYEELNGKPQPERDCETGVKYFNLVRDLRLYLRNRKNGARLGDLVKSYRGAKIIDGFSLKDPMPAVMDTWWTMQKVLKAS